MITYTCSLCNEFEIDTRDNTESECWSALCAHQETEHPSDLDWEEEKHDARVDGDEND